MSDMRVEILFVKVNVRELNRAEVPAFVTRFAASREANAIGILVMAGITFHLIELLHWYAIKSRGALIAVFFVPHQENSNMLYYDAHRLKHGVLLLPALGVLDSRYALLVASHHCSTSAIL